MSVRILSQVWEGSTSTGGRLLVLLALADCANHDGYCWPSVMKLAQMSRLSERQVKRLLRELDADGEISMPDGPRSEDRPFRVTPATPGHADTGTSASPQDDTGDTPRVTSTRVRERTVREPSIEPSPIEIVWDHYMEAVPSRRSLGAKQRAQIAAALRVRSVEEVCRAIDGLAASPHHQGQNDRGKKYLELRHAIVPKGAESIEERIDKAVDWAKEFGTGLPEVDPAKVARWKDEIAYTMSLPHRPERSRAEEALRKLRAYGYSVTRLSQAPWVRIER